VQREESLNGLLSLSLLGSLRFFGTDHFKFVDTEIGSVNQKRAPPAVSLPSAPIPM
jgi:hypothetical protein